MQKTKKNREWEKFSIFEFKNKLDKRKQPINTPTGYAQRMIENLERDLRNLKKYIYFKNTNTFIKITENILKKFEKDIAKVVNVAERDLMTKFFNKETFYLRAEELLKGNRDYAIIVIDLNNLKEINDNYGHILGDAYIMAIANAIKELASVYRITASRAGGDEFYLMLPLYDALKDKEKYISDFEKTLRTNFQNKLKADKIKGSFAMGYVIKSKIKKEEQTLIKMISLADAEMYRNKIKMKYH